MMVGFGHAGQAELNFTALIPNESGSLASSTTGGKAITGMDLASLQSEETMRERLIQESVKEIGKFVQRLSR
jgi:hypothetical protein